MALAITTWGYSVLVYLECSPSHSLKIGSGWISVFLDPCLRPLVRSSSDPTPHALSRKCKARGKADFFLPLFFSFFFLTFLLSLSRFLVDPGSTWSTSAGRGRLVASTEVSSGCWADHRFDFMAGFFALSTIWWIRSDGVGLRQVYRFGHG